MEFYKNLIAIVALAVITFNSIQPSVYLRRAEAAAAQEAEYKAQDHEEYDQNQDSDEQDMDESSQEKETEEETE